MLCWGSDFHPRAPINPQSHCATAETLGKVLLETYIYTLSELEFLPKSIILFNEAVLLTLPISDCCLYLKRLQDRGVEILVCDTSANYYDIVKKMQVGKLIGMKAIIEKQLGATKLINIS